MKQIAVRILLFVFATLLCCAAFYPAVGMFWLAAMLAGALGVIPAGSDLVFALGALFALGIWGGIWVATRNSPDDPSGQTARETTSD